MDLALAQKKAGGLLEGLEGADLIAAADKVFGAQLAMTSSFGSESVVELHMISQINPSIKVIFLNTQKLFGETLRYRDNLIDQLGLKQVLSLEPDPADVASLDPKGMLWRDNPDACCNFRKTRPQEKALQGVEALITGRKRFQTQSRANMPIIEWGADRVVINPLANWDLEKIHGYMAQHHLPTHPLVADGYISIGCMPCTARATAENYREGRWVGQDKEECGIHDDLVDDGAGI